MKAKTIIVAAVLLLSGCAQYTYVGRIDAKDSADQDREVLVYWTRTERALWFDTVAGGVRVLTECSTNTLDYEEKPQGVVFLRRPSDIPVGQEIALGEPCGSVLGAARIEALTTGPLELTVHCKPDTGDEFAIMPAAQYLQARDEPYRFPIERVRTDVIPNGAPQPQPCRR